MDYETVSAGDFGQSLRGIGLNLLSPDVIALARFLEGVFGASVHRLSADFAIVEMQGSLLQLHADGTFSNHPVLGLVPENPPRGGGSQFYVFGVDPDEALPRAEEFGGSVLEPAAEKPHGLYEGTVLSPEGYAFSPAIPPK